MIIPMGGLEEDFIKAMLYKVRPIAIYERRPSAAEEEELLRNLVDNQAFWASETVIFTESGSRAPFGSRVCALNERKSENV